MEIIIHDTRQDKEFNTITFSNYKKIEVIKALTTALNSQDFEGSVFWSCELLCSGRLKDIWDTFLQTMSKHIRIGNPKLAIYIASRFERFKTILMNGYLDNEIEVRNSNDMRNLIAEISLILCFSPKKPPLEMLKVNKQHDFSFEILGKQLKADSMEWCKTVLVKEDPHEILLATNEFAYHLANKNLLKCCYWVDWLIDFDTLCRKQKKPIIVKFRDFAKVDDKFKGDPIWVFWDLLIFYHKDNPETSKITDALIELFSIKYNFSQKRKRRHLMYLAIELYTEHIELGVPILYQKDKVKTILSQLGKFYQSIKKHEQRPEIISDKQKNLQKSIGKMKLLYDFM